MDSTLNDNGDRIRGDSGPPPGAAGSPQISDLIADVQDLLGQLAHVADPEIARLRKKVERAIATARKTVADGSQQVQRQARDAMHAGDQYVRNQPWQSVGIAALAGLVVGLLVSKR